jgi:hypothetical protein
MSSLVAILEKLISDESVPFKEHILETASRHVTDAEKRFDDKFDNLVREISTVMGEPEFNSHIRKEVTEAPGPTGEQKKSLPTVVPPWCQGTARSGGVPKPLRFAHWKKPEGVLYVILRTEIEPAKERPLYYDLVLGARRRKPDVDKTTEKLRRQEETLMSKFVAFLRYWIRGQ